MRIEYQICIDESKKNFEKKNRKEKDQKMVAKIEPKKLNRMKEIFKQVPY